MARDNECPVLDTSSAIVILERFILEMSSRDNKMPE